MPSETQTGANTFGCLVNGKVFLPKGISEAPRLTCYYQYIYYPSPNGYVFQVKANDKSNSSIFQSLNILCDSIKMSQDQAFF